MRSLKIILLAVCLCMACGGPGISESSADSGCNRAVPELFKEVSPAVVFIATASTNPYRVVNRSKATIGSGFIFSKDGYILTNAHVVFGQQHIIVTLDDESKIEAKLIGLDQLLDLAVLKIPVPSGGLSSIALGDSNTVQIGEEVLAIGNPFGLDQTLTKGIVSGNNRILPASPLGFTIPLIQTDAAINQGNSGGPLINKCGKVIGINTSMILGAQNIGFAVPANTAKDAIPELIEKGRVVRPWVGVHGKLIKKDSLPIINMPLADGFLVETVEPDSPAARANVRGGNLPISIAGIELLLGGDIITEFDGEKFDAPEKLLKFISSVKVGKKLRLTLYRDGKTRRVEFDIPEQQNYFERFKLINPATEERSR